MTEKARCRGCNRELDGKAYHLGGSAYVPSVGTRALSHFYGGYVCSGQCNRTVFMTMTAYGVASSEDARRIREGYEYFENQQ